MAKTVSEIEQQLDDVKAGQGSQVLLDPVTPLDAVRTGLLVAMMMSSLIFASREGFWAHLRDWFGAWLVLLVVGLALLSFNEYWVINFRLQRLEKYRSVLLIRRLRATYAFSDLSQIGVGGIRRNSKSADYWQYGLFLASKGQMLGLFPALSSDYHNVVELTNRLSQELGASMVEPRPFGILTYSNEKAGIAYGSGPAVSPIKQIIEAKDAGEPTPVEAMPLCLLPAEEVRSVGQQRLEFETRRSPGGQRGSAAFALLFIGPWFLSSASLLLEPGIGKKIWGLLLTLPLSAAVYYLVDWILYPVERRYEFVDGQAQQLGTVQIRGAGKTKVSTFDVPPGARLVILEKVGTRTLVHRIAIYQGETIFYVFESSVDSLATQEKAEQIAAALGIPWETRSDLGLVEV